MVSVRSNVYSNPRRPTDRNNVAGIPDNSHRIPLPNEMPEKKVEKEKEKLLPDYSIKSVFKKIKDNIELDDIILLVLALVLLKDDGDDIILLLLIAYILIDF